MYYLREKHPELPELTDVEARIARQPKTDEEERRTTERIYEIARAIRAKCPSLEVQVPYEVPVVSTAGLSPYVREMAEERWG